MDVQRVIKATRALEHSMQVIERDLRDQRQLAQQPEVCALLITLAGMTNTIRWFAEDVRAAVDGTVFLGRTEVVSGGETIQPPTPTT